jgi:hypothetical protein
MSDSVLDRIRQNRQRPAVATRDDTLITGVQQIDLAPTPELGEENLQTSLTSEDSDNTYDALEELKAELNKIPETNRHSAIVLEKKLDQDLARYCKDNRITIELFLEAAWIYASSNPSTMTTILVEAKHRYDDRKRAGKLRRLITMLESRVSNKRIKEPK